MNRSKDLFDKRYRYSIRRLSMGAASVAIGCLLFGVGAPHVKANTLGEGEPDSQPTELVEGSDAGQPSLEHSVEETEEHTLTEEEVVPASEASTEDPAAIPIVDNNDYKLRYTAPAATSYEGWEHEALPLGNGDMGTKVFGLIGAEKIQFNEKTLWSGGPRPDSDDYNGGNYTGKHAVLPEIRQALEAGDLERAKSLAEEHLVGPYNEQYGRYLSFGDILVDFTNQEKTLDSVTDYSRELDLTTAISSTSYVQNGTSFQRESFISYPDDVAVTHFTKTGDQLLDFEVTMRLTRDMVNGRDLGRVRQYTEQKSTYKTAEVTYTDQGILLSGRVNNNQLQFASFLGIQTDGEVTRREDRLVVTGASYATLLMNAATDFAQNPQTNYRRQVNLAEEVAATVARAKAKDYQALKEAHIADYQAIYNRVSLNLTANESKAPTDQLLTSYQPATGQELEELFFQYGRYLMITSSRDGENALPANLQGVWNAVDNPPWNSDYHLNVNLQMNYWPVYATNMAETALPLINYIDDMRYYGRVAAKEYAGIESTGTEENGWLAHTQATPFGWTTPGWSYYWGWSPASNAWIMQNVYDYYKFTQDQDYLRSKIYPMLRETAKFWNSFLHFDEESQRYVSSPSYSPEHGTITIGNTFDQSLVWQLFHDFMEAASILDTDQELVASVREKFEKLDPLHINSEGRIKEWYEEDTEKFTAAHRGEPGHRHVSELVGLFPGTLFNKDNPQYLEAAKATLNHRGDGGTGWSKANKINLWARLLDGNRAHRLLAEQLKGSTLRNLWDTHSPFQIDGNFGATSGMTEMLLQSHSGYIAPLPALPDAWKTGQVTGLVARGNVQVDMEWADKNLTKLILTARKGGKLVVDYPQIETARVRLNQQEVAVTPLQAGRIELMTQEGDQVIFDRILPRITDLTVTRQSATRAQLSFSGMEGARYYEIERRKVGETGQGAVQTFTSVESQFDDQTVTAGNAYEYRVRPVLPGVATVYSEPASIAAIVDILDDRDASIRYGSAYQNWSDGDLWSGTEKYADVTNNPNASEESVTAHVTFMGNGIEIYGNKSDRLGKALVRIDGRDHGEIDFYKTGTAEKRSLIASLTGLSDGEHTLTLIVKRDAPTRSNERNKISLDYFRVVRDGRADYEVLDDRDTRLSYGASYETWDDAALYAGTETFVDLTARPNSSEVDATVTLEFEGVGIQVYGLKTSSLGKASVLIDGEEKDPLIFHQATTEKGVLIGEYAGLSNGPHTLTIRALPESVDGSRKKISLDKFIILKELPQPTYPAKVTDVLPHQTELKVDLPSGPWTEVAISLPETADVIRIRNVESLPTVEGAAFRNEETGLYLNLASDRPSGLVTARTFNGEQEVGSYLAFIEEKEQEDHPPGLDTQALLDLIAQVEALDLTNLTDGEKAELETMIAQATQALDQSDQGGVDASVAQLRTWIAGKSAQPTETPVPDDNQGVSEQPQTPNDSNDSTNPTPSPADQAEPVDNSPGLETPIPVDEPSGTAPTPPTSEEPSSPVLPPAPDATPGSESSPIPAVPEDNPSLPSAPDATPIPVDEPSGTAPTPPASEEPSSPEDHPTEAIPPGLDTQALLDLIAQVEAHDLTNLTDGEKAELETLIAQATQALDQSDQGGVDASVAQLRTWIAGKSAQPTETPVPDDNQGVSEQPQTPNDSTDSTNPTPSPADQAEPVDNSPGSETPTPEDDLSGTEPTAPAPEEEASSPVLPSAPDATPGSASSVIPAVPEDNPSLPSAPDETSIPVDEPSDTAPTPPTSEEPSSPVLPPAPDATPGSESSSIPAVPEANPSLPSAPAETPTPEDDLSGTEPTAPAPEEEASSPVLPSASDATPGSVSSSIPAVPEANPSLPSAPAETPSPVDELSGTAPTPSVSEDEVSSPVSPSAPDVTLGSASSAIPAVPEANPSLPSAPAETPTPVDEPSGTEPTAPAPEEEVSSPVLPSAPDATPGSESSPTLTVPVDSPAPPSAPADSPTPVDEPSGTEPTAPAPEEEVSSPVLPSAPDVTSVSESSVIPAVPEATPSHPSAPAETPTPEDEPSGTAPTPFVSEGTEVSPSSNSEKKEDEMIVEGQFVAPAYRELPTYEWNQLETLVDDQTQVGIQAPKLYLHGSKGLEVHYQKGNHQDVYTLTLVDQQGQAMQPHGPVDIWIPVQQQVEGVELETAQGRLQLHFEDHHSAIQLSTVLVGQLLISYKAEAIHPSQPALAHSQAREEEKSRPVSTTTSQLPATGEAGVALLLPGLVGLGLAASFAVHSKKKQD